MKCRCSRGDCQTEAVVTVQYEVPDFAWNAVSFKQDFHQLMWNSPIGVDKIKSENCQVSFAFMCLPDQLGDNACMLDAYWNLWDAAFLHRGVDVGFPQEELRHVLGNNTKEYLALNTGVR